MSRIMFDKYDRDRSGYIDTVELFGLCRELGKSLSEEEMSMAMRVLDTNGDGRVSYEEFFAWWSKGAARWAQLALSEQELARLHSAIAHFNHFDADRSGAISTDEFPALHADLVRNGYTTKPLDECLKDLDPSGDCLISFNEYLDYLESAGSFKIRQGPETVAKPGETMEEALHRRYGHLTDEEFAHRLGVPRLEFVKLKPWKQRQLERVAAEVDVD